MSDDRRSTAPQPADADPNGEPLRFHAGEGGRRTPPTTDAAAYLSDLIALIDAAFIKGRAMVLNRTFTDGSEGVPEFAIVPMHGLTIDQAASLTTQWSLDVCDILGIEAQARPSTPPEPAMGMLRLAVDRLDGLDPDRPDPTDGGAA